MVQRGKNNLLVRSRVFNPSYPKYSIKIRPYLCYQARSHRRDNLKTLIQEGRFEVLTGGWVMTDEANVHMYAMVDQMIEGKLCV